VSEPSAVAQDEDLLPPDICTPPPSAVPVAERHGRGKYTRFIVHEVCVRFIESKYGVGSEKEKVLLLNVFRVART
jgi:hypothetical protein